MNKHELADFVRQSLIEQGKLPGGSKTPPVDVERGAHYPDVPPTLPGESAGEYTDRLTGADGTDRCPYDHARNRQCSIGYHNECSERHKMIVSGGCECPCHIDRDEGPQAGVTMTDAAAILGRLYFLPAHTAKIVIGAVRGAVLEQSIMGAAPDDSDEPDDLMPFEGVKDRIEAIRPHYSRPGDWFTVDVLKIAKLDKFVQGMPQSGTT